VLRKGATGIPAEDWLLRSGGGAPSAFPGADDRRAEVAPGDGARIAQLGARPRPNETLYPAPFAAGSV